MRWLAPVVALALGCATDGADSATGLVEGQRIRVDCIGMVPTADYETWTSSRTGTPELLRSDAGIVEGRRCDTYLSPDRIASLVEGQNADFDLNLRVHAFGRKWVTTVESEPVLTVDQAVGDWYMRGRYSARLWSEGTADDGVESAEFTGWIDYCDQHQHPECPYTIGGVLPYRFEASHRLMNLHGEANDCRALIDPATQALQVDVSVAVVNGINITQLYRTSCPNREDTDPSWYRNRLTFRAGGVTGPGSYGPYRVTDFGGTQLPSLEWLVPAPMLGQANRANMLNFYQYCGTQNEGWNFRTLPWTDYDSEVGVDSQCSWEIEDGDPGWVRISCSEVRNDLLVPGESPCQIGLGTCRPDCDPQRGTCGERFEWEGRCDIVTRSSP